MSDNASEAATGGQLPYQRHPKESLVFFFDIDNTLYAESTGIGKLMAERIRLYCVHIGMNEEDAKPAKQISHEAKPADEGLKEDQVKTTSDPK